MKNILKRNYALHPGTTLKEKLEKLKMTPQELAIKTDLPVDVILDILNKKGSITPEIAVKLEKALDIPANFWLAKQNNYNMFVMAN